ncbi:substrate-binding domain-containing protein [Streptomyces sp. NBC_00838]|uniref:GntR family transcriptional regulator n=1 Tax=Streptomyces sp. NBC_00838 TaxID=2903680 RepID=UPI00386645F4|nr:substrate-binding domain-containing protein [Streptomyces sp. NBC_00838]
MSPSHASVGTAAPRGHKTRHLADELRQAIAELRWPAGKLPTEQQLARDQGVSVNTVRRAVDLLVQEGLVYRRQGSGTYVSASPAVGTGYAVGVVVPSLTYYYPRVIAGIERELSGHGCRMLLRCTEWETGLEHRAVEELTRSGADGLIVVPTLGEDGPGSWFGRAEESAVPLVLVERGTELAATSVEFVCSHHAAGARAAVEHLLRLGHTRIGYAERISPHTAPQVRSGLAAGLERAGLDPAPVVATSLRRWTGQDADRFLDHLLRQRATAALCFADREASLLVGAARRRGLRVPEDLSVVGYDNEVADLCEVPLTAVAPAKADIGRRAAELVRARIAHPDAPRRQEALVPELVVRDSTGPVPRLHR